MSNDIFSQTFIGRITKRDAHNFLSRFEILGNVGLGVWHWGLRHDSDLVSVITFGTPCFGGKRGWVAKIANSNGLRLFQLCRGGTVPSAPKGTPSRAISLASKAMLKMHGPFIAVAYADEGLGEIGTIYQASGALYTGMTKPKGQANYIINGKKMSAWQVRRLYGTRDRNSLINIDSNLQINALKPKHRYLFILAPTSIKKRITDSIEFHLRPYPKRSQGNSCSLLDAAN